MKNLGTLATIFALISTVNSQSNLGGRIKENAKNSTVNRIENRAGNAVDRGLDKVEEGVRGAFKKNENGQENSNKDAERGEDYKPSNQPNTDETKTMSGNSESPNMQVYSKFDFIPGEKIILIEEFEKDEIGDFPVNWNTNGSGEVVRLSNRQGKWLKLNGDGIFYPDHLGVLPENVTIEFEVGTSEANQVQTNLIFVDAKNKNLLSFDYANMVEVKFNALGGFNIICRDGENADKLNNTKSQNQYQLPERPFVKVSIWKQGTRLRIYFNEEKMLDLPRAFEKNVDYRMIFSTDTYFLENREAYLGNFRVATGKPDTRSKLITEGKMSTTGIKFDSGSDKIKPESYGTLQEIANILKENPGIKIKIVGHTDSDGDAARNMELSKKRADSVRQFLNKEFGIPSESLETDGKGMTEPVAPNTSPEGKANNRRVEFIKL